MNPVAPDDPDYIPSEIFFSLLARIVKAGKTIGVHSANPDIPLEHTSLLDSWAPTKPPSNPDAPFPSLIDRWHSALPVEVPVKGCLGIASIAISGPSPGDANYRSPKWVTNTQRELDQMGCVSTHRAEDYLARRTYEFICPGHPDVNYARVESSGDGKFFCMSTNHPCNLAPHFLFANECHNVLHCFLAGAEIGDVPTLIAVFLSAKQVAGETKAWQAFAAALDKYVKALLLMTEDPFVLQNVVYYSVEAGEAHDAFYVSSGSTNAKILEDSCRSYREGAMATWKLRGDKTCGSFAHAWCCYGLALKRSGKYHHALRAYTIGLGVERVSTINRKSLKNIFENLSALHFFMLDQQTEAHGEERRKALDAHSMAEQVKKVSIKTGTISHVSLFCSNCLKNPTKEEHGSELKQILRCSRCLVACYCDVKCQREHWKAHKPLCRKSGAQDVDKAAAEKNEGAGKKETAAAAKAEGGWGGGGDDDVEEIEDID